jgi:NhaA family Na+:H+ antiporter
VCSSDLFANLFIALGILSILMALNILKVNNLIPYLVGGIFMWYFMLQSGIHATITGVLLAFAIPFGNGKSKTPSYIVLHFLEKPVAFFILPLFALANTCIVIGDHFSDGLMQSSSLGIMAGLVIGKPLGILLFSIIGVGLGICALPSDLKWKNIFGAGLLGGIGFTMSIFITLLAFDDHTTIDNSKITILLSSTIAGIIGFIWLKMTLKKPLAKEPDN